MKALQWLKTVNSDLRDEKTWDEIIEGDGEEYFEPLTKHFPRGRHVEGS